MDADRQASPQPDTFVPVPAARSRSAGRRTPPAKRRFAMRRKPAMLVAGAGSAVLAALSILVGGNVGFLRALPWTPKPASAAASDPQTAPVKKRAPRIVTIYEDVYVPGTGSQPAKEEPSDEGPSQEAQGSPEEEASESSEPEGSEEPEDEEDREDEEDHEDHEEDHEEG